MKTMLIATSVAVVGATASHASLIGTELRIGSLSQVTSSSELFLDDFPASAIVSETEVEFPSAESLFGDFPRPPNSFVVDTSIDAGADFLEVDFDNAGSGRFASWFENTYIFGFSSEALVTITGATVNRDVSNLGISDGNVYFDGGDLFVNVTGLPFNSSSFLRIDLASRVDPKPPEQPSGVIPLPAGFPLLLGGLALFGIVARRSKRC